MTPMKLKAFLATPDASLGDGRRPSHSAWATRVGVTRGYFSQLVNEQKVPSLPLAVLIEDATGGKVTCRDWIENPQSDTAPAGPAASQIDDDGSDRDRGFRGAYAAAGNAATT